MFRLLPGYEGCKINFGEQPVAFIAFSESKLAQNAKRSAAPLSSSSHLLLNPHLRLLNGTRFDPFVINPIRITYAKQNSKNKTLPAEFYPRWSELNQNGGLTDEEGRLSASSSANSSANAVLSSFFLPSISVFTFSKSEPTRKHDRNRNYGASQHRCGRHREAQDEQRMGSLSHRALHFSL